MRRNILNSLLILAVVCLATACKTKKGIVTVPKTNDSSALAGNKKAENFNLLKSKDFVFNTLSLRGKANLDINGNANNVNMNIRIKKDEKIWVSITAFGGIEAARAVITPDSILVLNRLQSTYLKKPFSYVYGFTNKEINFNTLQSVLSGNTIPDFLAEPSELTFDGGVWTLDGKKEDLAYKILFNTLLKVSETNLNDVKASQAFKVVYTDYQEINKSLFPTSLKINSMSGNKRINIDLSFSKIESNVTLEFPFSVPKRFEVIN